MGETTAKKEKEKKRAKQKRDKAEKMQERKANNQKGKNLDDMLAYLDENGNLTTTPPDLTRKTEISLEDIQLGAAKTNPEEVFRKGFVSYFNEAKGYGFITDTKTNENVFVHVNNIDQPLKEKDKVSFEREKTARGYSAINVKKIK